MNGKTEEVRQRKRLLREEVRRRMDALSDDYVRASGEAIKEAVLRSELWKRADSVLLYVSVRKEPDTRKLLSSALWERKKVYVPRCLPESAEGTRRMLAVRIRAEADLVPGRFSIPEPWAELPDPDDPEGTASASGLDLILVPCAAASNDGARLGHGAGYYDRFLAGLPAGKDRTIKTFPATLCLCHEALLTEGIPMTDLDVRMDYIVTEAGIRVCR